MELSAEDTHYLQKVKSNIENAKRRFLKEAFDKFLSGQISEEKFCEYLNRGELTEIFLKEYMGVNIEAL